MRILLAVCAAMLLAGCQSYYDEQQRVVDQQNAERDHAWCESVGIGEADPRYATCRAYAADLRIQAVAQRDARALGLMGVGTGLYGQSHERRNSINCQPAGAGFSCQSY